MGDINGTFKTEMENVARLHQKYPDHVLGFDAVGEEDAGNSLLYYVERFLTAGSQLPLYLHTTETSWPDDLINSGNPEDPVSTAQNAIDTLLLLAKRLGHATGFVKHPYRMELVRQQGIAIEACVVSNQILGYIPDLRQHPALIYYRSGIPIVLGADDPGTMGYDDFTVDWYQVYSAWGLDLSDLKTLALNSLSYSSMSPADKTIAIEQKWLPLWTQYIADLKTEACSYDFTSAALGPPSFGRILPREGANSGSTKVHIYGRNFETSICKSPKCRFGSAETPATYVDNTHLICDSPSPPDTSERTVSVAVALDGISFVETGELFTYKYSPIVVPQLR
jgi:adenosine deaminase CECR1